MRILLIDDNKPISDMYSLYFKISGHECTVANNGKEGIELILRQKFDLVLLDLLMTGFNGFSVLDELDELNKTNDLRLIVLTAMDLKPHEQAELLKRGVNHCFDKKLPLDELIKRIELVASMPIQSSSYIL
ncbi:MAG: response regulator transcription factor [Thaumarchaeota archaeon]|nr:MAG: response regulator transcription factor [Nitrososphaerota archaeon]TLX96391.1 MAG: response regulator transcription factor [Nitrososphaerota archaeon]